MRIQRLSKEGKELYNNRCQKIERSFADSKNNHGYRYAMYKGIGKNQNYTWLICAAQNMKNIAIRREKVNEKLLTNSYFIKNITIIFKKFIKFKKIQNLFSKENPHFLKSMGLSTI